MSKSKYPNVQNKSRTQSNSDIILKQLFYLGFVIWALFDIRILTLDIFHYHLKIKSETALYDR